MAEVTWENPVYFSVSGNTATAQLDASSSANGATNGQKVCRVQSAETLDGQDDYFQFVCPGIGSGTEFWIGVSAADNPACTPVGGSSSHCDFALPEAAFHINGTSVSGTWTTDVPMSGSLSVKPATVFAIQLFYNVGSDVSCYWAFDVDGRYVGRYKLTVPTVAQIPQLRLVIVAGTRGGGQPSVTANINRTSTQTNQVIRASVNGSVVGDFQIFATGAMRLGFVGTYIDEDGLVQPSAIATFFNAQANSSSNVTWQNANNVNITGNQVIADIDPDFNASGNPNDRFCARAQSAQVLQNFGDYFEFTMPEYNAAITYAPYFWVGITQYDNPVPRVWGSPWNSNQYNIVESGASVYDNNFDLGATLEPAPGFSYDAVIGSFARNASTVIRLMLATLVIPACADTWVFPTPAAYPIGDVLYTSFSELVPDWGNFGLTFADKLPAHNTIQSVGVRRFEIQYDGLDAAQLALLDAHYDSTSSGAPFTLTHPRTAETLTGVRYDDGGYARSSHSKKWSQSRTVRLIQTP